MKVFRLSVLVLLLVLTIALYFLIQYRTKNYSGGNTFIGDLSFHLNTGNFKEVYADLFTDKNQLTNPKVVRLQEVSNLGYTFYVGQVDYPNTPNISDDIKNQITQIVANAKFPKSLLRQIPIVILNSLAVRSGQYLVDPNTHSQLPMPPLDQSFLNESGIYDEYSNRAVVVAAVIYVNKTTVIQGSLTDALTHELGHAIGAKLTDQDWKKFYQLRNIPAGTSRSGTNWVLSPTEDFAEVYKSIFTGLGVKTSYGAVNQQTKGFVISIVNKLSQ